MASASEPSTGAPERKITFREIIRTLEEIASEESSSHKAYGSQRGKHRAEVLDATRNLVLAFLPHWDALKERRARRVG